MCNMISNFTHLFVIVGIGSESFVFDAGIVGHRIPKGINKNEENVQRRRLLANREQKISFEIIPW